MSEFLSGGSRGGGLAGGLPGGVKLAAIGLLLHQLMKHARSGQGEAAPARPPDDGSAIPMPGPSATPVGGPEGSPTPSPATAQGTGAGGSLGDLLSGLLGGGGGGQRAGQSGGVGDVLGGLLGGGGGAQGQGGPGLGGMLGGLLGAGAGGGLLGGLAGMLQDLQKQGGLAPKVDSWIKPGPNQPVSAQELEPAFDPQELDEAASRAGTDRHALLDELSRMLPKAVDGMTPQGRPAQREEDVGAGGLGGLLGNLLGGDAGRSPERQA
jgi:uncharacterized protein YidB (DUF937 family)